MKQSRSPDINVGIISTLRPELLSKTLKSFSDQVFWSANINEVYVNLDNAFGDGSDLIECHDIIKTVFPNAEINTPNKPGFTKAVKSVWSAMPDGPFLYLEDDWICLDSIDLRLAVKMLNERTKMISFLSEQHGKKGRKEFSIQNIRPRIGGLPIGPVIRTIPAFNTSPCLVDGAFARQVADLFDLSKDPEKQMRMGGNEMLNSYTKNYQCKFLKSRVGNPVIRDIGRDWQRERGITKITNGLDVKWRITD